MARLLETRLPLATEPEVRSEIFNKLIRVLEINLGSYDTNSTPAFIVSKRDQLNSIDRRIERQKTEADEYCKDLVACFQVIRKVLSIEQNREEHDRKDKVIALGSAQDISPFFSFVWTPF